MSDRMPPEELAALGAKLRKDHDSNEQNRQESHYFSWVLGQKVCEFCGERLYDNSAQIGFHIKLLFSMGDQA